MPTRPETLEGILTYFPSSSRPLVKDLFVNNRFNFTITRAHKTKLGSFKGARAGTIPSIFINYDLGQFSFLIIFLHELAHFMVWSKYKQRTAPHGIEWKKEFIQLAIPFFQQNVFPEILVPELKNYFRTTPATMHRSINLVKILAELDGKKVSLTLNDIPHDATFRLKNGNDYIKMEKQRTRYKCFCLNDKKYYLVPKSAQIIQP